MRQIYLYFKHLHFIESSRCIIFRDASFMVLHWCKTQAVFIIGPPHSHPTEYCCSLSLLQLYADDFALHHSLKCFNLLEDFLLIDLFTNYLNYLSLSYGLTVLFVSPANGMEYLLTNNYFQMLSYYWVVQRQTPLWLQSYFLSVTQLSAVWLAAEKQLNSWFCCFTQYFNNAWVLAQSFIYR